MSVEDGVTALHISPPYTHPLLADGQQPTADQHLSLHSPAKQPPIAENSVSPRHVLKMM